MQLRHLVCVSLVLATVLLPTLGGIASAQSARDNASSAADLVVAATAPPVFSVGVPSSVLPGDALSVVVSIDTMGTPITGWQFGFTYDPTILQLQAANGRSWQLRAATSTRIVDAETARQGRRYMTDLAKTFGGIYERWLVDTLGTSEDELSAWAALELPEPTIRYRLLNLAPEPRPNVITA